MYFGTGIQPEIMKKNYLKKKNEKIIAQHKPYCANKKIIEKFVDHYQFSKLRDRCKNMLTNLGLLTKWTS